MNYIIHNADNFGNINPQIDTCLAHSNARPGCSPNCNECAARLTQTELSEAYKELIAAAVPAEMIDGIPHYRIARHIMMDELQLYQLKIEDEITRLEKEIQEAFQKWKYDFYFNIYQECAAAQTNEKA